ncbi:hypothetical protein [Mycoplasma seminis]|uniref:DUF262 domain-containing protein n=1 Tax=Mycoplasma seminis TaxID=512749 RepID=A0ABY9HAC3_9MOLU|nr:hypothetical protein [Mycoplasma seminis]WLP85554.1 hypothetical protein Q8852_00030 [Mycoplasma seminis]
MNKDKKTKNKNLNTLIQDENFMQFCGLEIQTSTSDNIDELIELNHIYETKQILDKIDNKIVFTENKSFTVLKEFIQFLKVFSKYENYTNKKQQFEWILELYLYDFFVANMSLNDLEDKLSIHYEDLRKKIDKDFIKEFDTHVKNNDLFNLLTEKCFLFYSKLDTKTSKEDFVYELDNERNVYKLSPVVNKAAAINNQMYYWLLPIIFTITKICNKTICKKETDLKTILNKPNKVLKYFLNGNENYVLDLDKKDFSTSTMWKTNKNEIRNYVFETLNNIFYLIDNKHNSWSYDEARNATKCAHKTQDNNQITIGTCNQGIELIYELIENINYFKDQDIDVKVWNLYLTKYIRSTIIPFAFKTRLPKEEENDEEIIKFSEYMENDFGFLVNLINQKIIKKLIKIKTANDEEFKYSDELYESRYKKFIDSFYDEKPTLFSADKAERFKKIQSILWLIAEIYNIENGLFKEATTVESITLQEIYDLIRNQNFNFIKYSKKTLIKNKWNSPRSINSRGITFEDLKDALAKAHEELN